MTTNIFENLALQTSAGQDAAGRFTIGNKCGRGNPYGGKVAELRQAFLHSVTPDDIEKIVRSMIKLAHEGSLQAAKLVLLYVVGKPELIPDSDKNEMEFKRPPSTNGFFQEAPQTNGQPAPLPRANAVPESPSPNGDFQEAPPSTNGDIQTMTPSTNGDFAPALNRKQRRALRKERRLAKSKRNTPVPVM
jgi:hypothetical protein